MKSRIYFLLVACIFFFSANAQKVVRESMKLASPPEIDGQMEDWQGDWLMDSRSKFLYAFANDSNNMYIRLKVSDPLMQQKVLFFGLTLYFNPENTSKKGPLGLHYPLPKTEEEMKRITNGDAAKDKPWLEVKKALVQAADLLELIGLSKDPISSPTVGLMNGLQIVMAIDQFGDLVYEAKIPFKSFRIDKSKIENLGLTLETGRLMIKQPLNSPKATYYHGVRYAGPANTQPQNAFTQATILHLAYKLN